VRHTIDAPVTLEPLALLCTEGMSGDVGADKAELNRQLIMRKKLLPSELGRIPMDLIELRHLADYKPQSVTAREAKRAYDRAARFLAAIKKALGKIV